MFSCNRSLFKSFELAPGSRVFFPSTPKCGDPLSRYFFVYTQAHILRSTMTGLIIYHRIPQLMPAFTGEDLLHTIVNHNQLPCALWLLSPAPHGRKRPVDETTRRSEEKNVKKDKTQRSLKPKRKTGTLKRTAKRVGPDQPQECRTVTFLPGTRKSFLLSFTLCQTSIITYLIHLSYPQRPITVSQYDTIQNEPIYFSSLFVKVFIPPKTHYRQ